MPAGDPRRAVLEVEGWTVTARSFGAQLDAEGIDTDRLRTLVSGIGEGVVLRPLRSSDLRAVLALDRATAGDYPGSVATQHEPLTVELATPSATRRGFGAVDGDGELVGMTWVDVDVAAVETDFTVVRGDRRQRGIGVALKASSVLALQAEGVRRFRTGGSADNAAILRANAVLGYVCDEEWVTLELDRSALDR